MLSFVLSVTDLFNGVFQAIVSVPVLDFFMSALLFFVVFSLFGLLVALGRKGKL